MTICDTGEGRRNINQSFEQCKKWMIPPMTKIMMYEIIALEKKKKK